MVERYIYTAYGQQTVLDDEWTPLEVNLSACGNTVLYAGYGFDAETGLYWTDTRLYHPTLGRWTSQDLIPYPDGMNLYQYCCGNPAGATDPTGLMDLEKVMNGIWGVGEGAIEILSGMPSDGMATGNIPLLAKQGERI